MKSDIQNTPKKAKSSTYNFDILAIFSEAWSKVSGFKAKFWSALSINLILTFISSFIAVAIDSSFEGISSAEVASSPKVLVEIIEMFFSIFLVTPIFAGLIMMSIKHILGQTVEVSMIFQYFKFWRKLSIYPIVMTGIELIKIAFLDYDLIQIILLLVMAIFSFLYFMYTPLIVEKNLPVWTALETSRKAISAHWLKMLCLLLLLIIIFIGSFITLGIALIWTLPFIYNTIAILYRNMFGIRQLSP